VVGGRRSGGGRERGGGTGAVYEAYEVKNKRQKMRCLLLHRKKKNIFYLFMMSLLWKFFINAPVYTTDTLYDHSIKFVLYKMCSIECVLYRMCSP